VRSPLPPLQARVGRRGDSRGVPASFEFFCSSKFPVITCGFAGISGLTFARSLSTRLSPSRTGGWRFSSPRPQILTFRTCSSGLLGLIRLVDAVRVAFEVRSLSPAHELSLFARVISWVSPCNLGLHRMKWWFARVICCLGFALTSPVILSARWLRA